MKLNKHILLPLAVFCVSVLVWVEILHHRAGGVLPRENSGKWRVLGRPERVLKIEYEQIYRSENSLAEESPLPIQVEADIHSRAEADTKKLRAEAKLRDVVATFGLIQYPVSILLGLAGTVWLLFRRSSTRILLPITYGAIGYLCFGMAIYRSYFTSLGW